MVATEQKKLLKRIYDQEYREKNRLKIREQKRLQMARWRKANPEKFKAALRKHYWKNPERKRAYFKDWRNKHPEYRHIQCIKQYGLTKEEYAALLASQEGVCAICGQAPKTRRLAVDHDHNDGHVRGLLCGACNTFVGRYEAADLAAVEAYLNRGTRKKVGENR